MIDQLENIYIRYESINKQLLLPEIIADTKKYIQLSKECKELEKLVKIYKNYKNILSNIENTKKILLIEEDEEFKDMAKAELGKLEQEKELVEEKVKIMLIPKDLNDSKNVILEIRAGTGGDEAAIFAGDLFRMYLRYTERMAWKSSLIDYTEGTSGGYKEIILLISGEDVYGKLKYESGVHRVQRVPVTETQGRIHTSAASIVILPEMEEVDITIDMKDIKIDRYCSSGPGGQSVNTTYSAVRLTHVPTGTIAQCQDQKSQLKNLDKAMSVLRSRIYEMELQKHNEKIENSRRAMVGSGDRSSKIRTYNYPQGRVTDHRIHYTAHNLSSVLDGQIENFIEKLHIADNKKKMKEKEKFF